MPPHYCDGCDAIDQSSCQSYQSLHGRHAKPLGTVLDTQYLGVVTGRLETPLRPHVVQVERDAIAVPYVLAVYDTNRSVIGILSYVSAAFDAQDQDDDSRARIDSHPTVSLDRLLIRRSPTRSG